MRARIKARALVAAVPSVKQLSPVAYGLVVGIAAGLTYTGAACLASSIITLLGM